MKIFRSVFTIGLLAFLLFLAVILDDWLGLLAYRAGYLLFCLGIAGLIAMAWTARSNRSALIAGSASFLLLLIPLFVNQPSSRILRSILLQVQTGMPADLVETLVEEAYRDSGYVMPRINRDADRIHVSLSSQHPGDCTAAVFDLSGGRVVRDRFSAD